MYHPKVVEKNLRRAGELISRKHDLPRKWELRYPTPGEREEMHAHLESLVDHNGVPSRPLNREEGLWVLCETTLAKLDYQYYSANYAKIEDWESRIVTFKRNVAQTIV